MEKIRIRDQHPGTATLLSVTWPHLDCPESGGIPAGHQVELEPGARVRLRQPTLLQVAPVYVDAAQEGLRTLAPAPHVQGQSGHSRLFQYFASVYLFNRIPERGSLPPTDECLSRPRRT